MSEESRKTICVDFDGVIHSYGEGWKDGVVYGTPNDGAREVMKEYVDKGYKVVILTARIQPKYEDSKRQKVLMQEWLGQNGFIVGEHYHEITNNKPSAIMYIDDKAVRFTNWDDMRRLV